MEYIVKDSWLTEVADAIREKKGSTEPILSDDFASEIESIESGGGESGENKLVQILSDTLEHVIAEDLRGAPKLKKYLFEKNNSLKSIAIPNSVMSIENSVFEYCENLTSVTFEENSQLTDIGKQAFRYCRHLESINIPDNVTTIGSSAFYSCSNRLTSIEIPNSVTSIGDGAFTYCQVLTSVTFAENSKLTSIEYQAFTNCTSLTSIEIPNSVTSIGTTIFGSCSSLTSVSIGNGLMRLPYQAFINCTSLTSVTIPSNVNTIGEKAFNNCRNLRSITIEADTAPTLESQNAFDNVPTDCIFTVKNLDSYNSTNWANLRDKYTFIELEE